MTASENSYQSISFTSKSNDKSSKASSARNSTSGASSRHNSGHATTRGSANNYNVVSIQNVQDSSECPVPAPMPTRRSLYGMQHRLEPTLPDVAKQRHVLADTVTRQYSTSLSSNKPSVVSIPGPSNHSSNAPSANASLLPENISNLTINSPGSPIGQPDAEGTPHAVHLRPTDSQKSCPVANTAHLWNRPLIRQMHSRLLSSITCAQSVIIRAQVCIIKKGRLPLFYPVLLLCRKFQVPKKGVNRQGISTRIAS